MSTDCESSRCKGDWTIGNNCGKCHACRETAQYGVAELRRRSAIIRRYRETMEKIQELARLATHSAIYLLAREALEDQS